MAVGLGVALSGPRSYHGEARAFPFVNDAGRHEIGPAEIDDAVQNLWRAWAAAAGGVALIALLW